MKREALEHPKLHQLAADLVAHVRAPERWSLLIATGLLERVWGFAGKQKVPDGAFDQASIAHLARAVGWPGRPDSMRDSLVRCKFFDLALEGRFIIHGWSEHCDRWVHRRLVRLGKSFADGKLPNAGYADTKDRRQPEDEPSGQPAAQPGGRPHARSRGPQPLKDRTVPSVQNAASSQANPPEERDGVSPRINGTDETKSLPPELQASISRLSKHVGADREAFVQHREAPRVAPSSAASVAASCSTVEPSLVESRVDEIVKLTGDTKPESLRFFRKASARLPEAQFRKALAETAEAMRETVIERPGALFVSKAQPMLGERRERRERHA